MKGVPHYTPEVVAQICKAAGSTGRHGERNALLIRLLFDGAFRISEALALTPADLGQTDNGAKLKVWQGKGGKYRVASISPSMAHALMDYAIRRQIAHNGQFFPLSRFTAHGIVKEATVRAGIQVPPKVGAAHVLRHAGAIALLRATGDVNMVQHQLGHTTPHMTLRYLKTVQQEDAMDKRGNLELSPQN